MTFLLLLSACGTRFVADGVEVVVRSPPDRVHEARLEVALADPLVPELSCSAQDDDHERHRLRGTASTPQTLVLTGLLADTTYDCSLTTDAARLDLALTTGPLSPLMPEWTVTGSADDHDGAWTLFNHGTAGHHATDEKLVVVDAQGRVRWSYTLPVDPGADIDVSVVDGDVLYGGTGLGGRPTRLTLDHERVWRAPVQTDREHYHHHVQDIPGVGIMTLERADDTTLGGSGEGFAVVVRDPVDNAVVWQWSSAEAIANGDLTPGVGPEDPYHANWLDWRDEVDGPALYVGLKTLDRILRVDRDTGRVTDRIGGNTDWVLADGDGLGPADWFHGQHAPEFNLDRLLVYDNGTGRSSGGGSRVIEYQLDPASQTATPLWSWTETDFDESVWGDADRTPSGDHVLVAKAHCYNCPGSPPAARSALVELDPGSGDEVWRLELEGESDAIYRAERLAGCDLFDHLGACP